MSFVPQEITVKDQVVNLDWPGQYLLKEGGTKKQNQKLLILLHGYQQSADWMFRRLAGLDFTGRIVAPNGPFPIPFKKDDKWLMCHGWYFFDPATAEYKTPVSFAIEYLHRLLAPIINESEEIRVIGFSQGGYVAPFFALDAKENVRLNGKFTQVIAVNARYRSEILREALPFRVDGIHGLADTMVDPQRAEACHRELVGFGNRGVFVGLPDTGHEITERVVAELNELLGRS